MFTLNCRGTLISFETPIVMGVLNITPDSFYTGYMGSSSEEILNMADKMREDGATIIDIGGQSSRPGSDRISPEEELARVLPAISAIRNRFNDTIISIDTYSSLVATRAVEAGADIINDISFGEMDQGMLEAVGKLKVPYIGMHMKGTPQTMQQNPTYENVALEILDYFNRRIPLARAAGITDLIIDPGFGFGKTTEHNLALLNKLEILMIAGYPLLAGLSRKNTICKILGISTSEALNGTTVMNTIALLKGASILRVHDVREAVEAVKLVEAYKKMAPVEGSHFEN